MQFIAVICPQNKYIRNIINSEMITKFNRILNMLKDKYNLQVLDYFDSKLFNLSDFYDISYLNKYRAKKLMTLLEKDIAWKID